MNNIVFLGRGIHNQKFLKSLINGNLKQMLFVINEDKELDVQIRNNYLNIYYKGGNIAKVNSENSVDFDEFYFYLDMKKVPKKIIIENREVVNSLIYERNLLVKKFKERDYLGYFTDAKKVMDVWFAINDKPERMEQHLLSVENKFEKSDYTIIDLEYQVSTLSDFACTFTAIGKDKPKKPRFDIIAVDKQGVICVIEFKKGIDALKYNSGLKEHWACYQHSIEKRYGSFIKEMEIILTQKQAFNLVDRKLKIIYPIPRFMFAYSYDDKNSIQEQDKKFQEEYNKIGEPIKVLKLAKDTYKLLD